MLSFQFAKKSAIKSFSFYPTKSPKEARAVYGSHADIYKNIRVIKSLNGASVYLISSNITKLKYVMKIFPFERDHPRISFRNESRFAGLRHRNIISSLYFENERDADFGGESIKMSYIIREYAPNGDFIDFLSNNVNRFDEKIARTYFRQLIEGLEYLHKNKIAHLDLKLHNLLVDQDYNLKISDFDLAYYEDDAIIIGNGTKFYRAPEIVGGRCAYPKAADIFSAGIILFAIYARGILPLLEDEKVNKIDFASLLYNEPAKFWAIHSQIQKHNNITFDEGFQDLFTSMTQLNPQDRPTIEMIKASKWYNGPYYNSEELKYKIKSVLLQ